MKDKTKKWPKQRRINALTHKGEVSVLSNKYVSLNETIKLKLVFRILSKISLKLSLSRICNVFICVSAHLGYCTDGSNVPISWNSSIK